MQVSATSISSHTMPCTITMSVEQYLITHNHAPSPCQWNNTSSHTIMHHHHVSVTSTSSHTMPCTITMSVEQYLITHNHALSPCQCDKYLITHNHAPSPCQWNNTSSHTIMHHHHVSGTIPHHTQSCTITMSVEQYLITHNHAPSPCQWNNTSSHTIMHHHHNHPLTMQTAPHRCTQVSATSTSSHTMPCTIIMSVQQVPHHTQSCTITMSVEQYLITHCHAPSPPSQSHHTDCTPQVHMSQTNMYLINHSFMITISTLSP